MLLFRQEPAFHCLLVSLSGRSRSLLALSHLNLPVSAEEVTSFMPDLCAVAPWLSTRRQHFTAYGTVYCVCGVSRQVADALKIYVCTSRSLSDADGNQSLHHVLSHLIDYSNKPSNSRVAAHMGTTQRSGLTTLAKTRGIALKKMWNE